MLMVHLDPNVKCSLEILGRYFGFIKFMVVKVDLHIEVVLHLLKSFPVTKILVLFIFIFYFFLERGREGERETSSVVASHTSPTGDLAHDPGMCAEWELNW